MIRSRRMRWAGHEARIREKRNHSITSSWSGDLLEKLPIVQPFKNFPAFYETRRFITVFTTVLHWSLS
jgi:hypothetical protein